MPANGSGSNAMWVDDHLDLYNYALQIGDEAWQSDLLNALRSASDAKLRRALLEKAWTLKIERIRIGRQIHLLHPKHEK